MINSVGCTMNLSAIAERMRVFANDHCNNRLLHFKHTGWEDEIVCANWPKVAL